MFLRELEGQFPSKDTVYEYSVDKQAKSWVAWDERLPNNWRYSTNTPFPKIYVPTVESVRFEFLIKAMINAHQPLLLTGEAASGKTALVKSILNSLDFGKSSMHLSMHARTTTAYVQSAIESHLEKRTKNVYSPTGGKYLVAFVDNLNVPNKDQYGSQPPLEFLRYWMEYAQSYDRQKQTVKSIDDVLILAAMGGSGKTAISARVQNRFHVLNLAAPKESSILRIYRTIINQKLQDFEEEIKPCGELITAATVDIYKTIATTLLPTPSKMHYTFSLRDLSKVYQGLLRANREYYDSRESVIKLWLHEMQRVFCDRLTTTEDRTWVLGLLGQKLAAKFDMKIEQLLPAKSQILFADCMTDSESKGAIYQEIVDVGALRSVLEERLEAFNSSPKNTALRLILFEDAIAHLCRIMRVIRLSRGHALLVGVGGSGRQSLARLATHVCAMSYNQIKVTKATRLSDFQEQLKHVYAVAGMQGTPSVLHLTLDPTFVGAPGFMEEIACVLAGGEGPQFYSPEERSEIRDVVRAKNKELALLEGQDNYMDRFFETVRDNLHLVMSISPHAAFRDVLRMFPVFFNHAVVDWFSAWPDEALLEVVTLKISSNTTADSEAATRAIAKSFVGIHTSVYDQSSRLLQELRRYNYVMPASFLDCVDSFQLMLRMKRQEFGDAASKLRNGLGKLDETRVNVETISKELEVSRTQITTFQRQCEEYLVVIVQQKREADEQAKQVTAKSDTLKQEEEEVRAIAKLAEEDLALALPVFEAAAKSLEALSKKDLQEIKSYGKPPPLVEKVLEAVMVLRKCEPTWEESKRQLGNPNFIKQLISYDKEYASGGRWVNTAILG